MAHPVRVLFYSDAADFGGHELMTLAGVRHMVAQANVDAGFMFFRGNLRLARQLNELAARYPGFKVLPHDYQSQRLQILRTRVSWRAIRGLASTIAAHAPDVVVTAQGGIAVGSAGLMAAERAGVPSICYIPMTHPESVFSASRVKAALREWLNRLYYGLPDAYITISPRMTDYLQRRGLQQPVTVVQNGIDLTAYRSTDRGAARARWGLSEGARVFGLIGRVQFWQKRQDLAVKALALARQQAPNLKLLVVGEGPDLDALKALARAEGVANAVVFAPWTDDMSSVYAAIDALAIPSRFEGVPLVMLEAMVFRRPVIASDVDGMADMLPPHWLFPSGDAAAFAARLVDAALADETALLEFHRSRILESHSLPAFEAAFMAAIESAVERLGRSSSAPTSKTTADFQGTSVAIIEPVGGHGGMNYYDFGLCRGLVDAGITPTLHTCNETAITPGLPFAVALPYHRIYGPDPAWRRGLRFVRGSLRALVGARRAGNKLAHFHIFQVGVLELFNILVAKLLLMRVVITAHDVEAFRGEWSAIKSWVYALADAVIAHNRVSQRELMRVLRVPEHKIHVIPHGNYLGYVGDVTPTVSARARLNLPSEAKVLLFFGQIKAVKGLDLLLDAMTAVKDVHPDVLLVIAGKMWGQEFAVYQAQIDRLGLAGRCVSHIRYVADDEVAAYYAAADLVVLPYRRIYQSGVILMAMSYGKPVLASDLDGMQEVIEDEVTGFLFPSADLHALATRLNTVLADPDAMRRVGAQGLALMRSGYGWDHIGRLTAQCYRAALRGNRQ